MAKSVIAMGSLSKANIYIDDTPGVKMAEIRAKCRRLAKEKRVGLIVIDYLQLIEGSGQENRQQEVSAISRQLKKLAKELRVPVIALSQLSRGVEQRQDKRTSHCLIFVNQDQSNKMLISSLSYIVMIIIAMNQVKTARMVAANQHQIRKMRMSVRSK